MNRRRFLKAASGLLLPAAPAIILPSVARAQLAGGLMFPGPGTPHTSGGGSLVFTPTDAQFSSPGPATSGSFASVNIGAASSDRIVMIGVMANVGVSAFTMTIGSTPATLAIVDSTFGNLAIFYANVSTGTSPAISWTNGSGITSLLIAVAQIHGQSGGGGVTPTTSQFASSMAQPIGPLSATVTAGGVAFVVAGAFNGAASPTFTWTNTAATNGDETISNGSSLELGSTHMTATSASVTVSSSAAMSFAAPTMLAASWGP